MKSKVMMGRLFLGNITVLCIHHGIQLRHALPDVLNQSRIIRDHIWEAMFALLSEGVSARQYGDPDKTWKPHSKLAMRS